MVQVLKGTRNGNVAESYVQGDKEIKEVVISGQDPSFLLCLQLKKKQFGGHSCDPDLEVGGHSFLIRILRHSGHENLRPDRKSTRLNSSHM